MWSVKNRSGRTYFLFLVALYFTGGILLAMVSKYLLPDEAVKRVFARMVSPLSGHLFYGTRPREDITVFALDERDLAEYKATYPVPYRFHAQRLRSIASYRPRAIFIDFWFPDERDDPQVEALADEICKIRASGVRVYLGSLTHHGSDYQLRSVLRDLKSQRVEMRDGGSEPCAAEVSVAKQTDSLDRITWEYDIRSLPPEGSDGAALTTAAARIYADLYAGSGGLQRDEPLALVWGTDPHPHNAAWMTDHRSGKPLCRGSWHWTSAVPGVSTVQEALDPSFKTPLCPYHLMLPLRALRQLNQEDHPWKTSLDELIFNKVIIYGGNLQSVDDLVYSPVHGRLPGTLMHAMALDNLIARGNGYPAAGDFDITDISARTSIVPLFAVLLLSVFAAARRIIGVNEAFRKRLNQNVERLASFVGIHAAGTCVMDAWRRAAPWKKTAGRLAAHIVLALAILLLVASLAAWLEVGTLTWIEFALVPMLFGYLKIGETMIGWIEERIGATPHKAIPETQGDTA